MNDILQRLTEVHGVKAALFATNDGLLIEGSGRDIDLDIAAAVTTSVMQAADGIARLDSIQAPTRLSVESDTLVVIMEQFRDEMVVAVVLDDPSNAGYVRFLLDREHRQREVAVGVDW
ncbi:MAG TPA: roadblock/LC7 domain-containing protein [Chloroflexota bacterium]|jgi:predicted regulator of Ras-like GTPase activity (Roadblock/LC7/MglB family)|nr:roadblock/LC7 domain-containing protein [Chloroflexota bacterium]